MISKVIKFLASLKLAFFILILIAVISSIGTFVEARYDAAAASKLVYRTWWMGVILGVLAINLIAVMVDRWPWKQRHGPFLAAHIGILMMMLGFVVTSYGVGFFGWKVVEPGIDGTMRIGIGESNRFVTLPLTDLQIWSSFDGDKYSKMIDQPVDFFLDHPKDHPLEVQLMEGPLKVVDYIPYALPQRQVLAADSDRAGSAVRFQIANQMVNVSEWIVQNKPTDVVPYDLGPAKVYLGKAPEVGTGEYAIYLEPLYDQSSAGKMKYTLFDKENPHKIKKGILSESESLSTGWMGLELKLLRYLPRAQQTWDFRNMDRPTPLTTAAINVEFLGKNHWVQLNDVVKFFTENGVYIVTYSNRRVDVGFPITLKKFEVGRYQGTLRAASYESLVDVPEKGEVLISMNDPLKKNGLTFYQASFQEGPTGEPVASILSVNHDPGRWLKYLGCLIMSIGVVWLFVNKRKSARAMAPKDGVL